MKQYEVIKNFKLLIVCQNTSVISRDLEDMFVC